MSLRIQITNLIVLLLLWK